jgi:hypothetical protein
MLRERRGKHHTGQKICEYHLLYELEDIQKIRGRKNEHRSKVKNIVYN